MHYGITNTPNSHITTQVEVNVMDLYRSFDYNPPVCYEQAINTPYPWIKFNDYYWINREKYESFMISYLQNPILMQGSNTYYEILNLIKLMYDNDLKSISNYAILASPKINLNKLYLAAKRCKAIKFIGSNETIDTISYNLCGIKQYTDFDTDINDILSDEIACPLVLTKDATIEFKHDIKCYINTWTV